MITPWEANLAALGRRTAPLTQGLARELALRGPAPDLGLRSRDGRVLPGVALAGRPRSLVSTFDPVKEADRWVGDWAGGTAAVFGAAGRDAWEALVRRGMRLGFWIDPRIEVWQSLFTWEDWTGAIGGEAWVPVWTDAADWDRVLRDRYHPLWDGGFQSFDWRGATAGQEALWDPYRQTARTALEALTSDLSTQARFGERWYRNTLANLKRLEPGTVPGCPGARVVVAGAGPGLEDALDDPVNRRWVEDRSRSGDRLFSTDTAYPGLTARGIVPDLVLCLDGQLPTYHHFVPAGSPGVPLVADLASIPLLGRLNMPGVRYLSGHPFGTVIRRHFPELPTLDGSLGNVSGLAFRTAQALGARRVDAWGADFCYRNGQAYARGTYVYDLAARRTGRLEPMETRLGSMCYGARGLERTQDSQGRALDTTALLRDYRQRWGETRAPAAPVTLAHGEAGPRWEAFAADWDHRLETLPLPPPGTGFHGFVRTLAPDRRQDWLALWPLALSLRLRNQAGEDLPQATVSRARVLLDQATRSSPSGI